MKTSWKARLDVFGFQIRKVLKNFLRGTGRAMPRRRQRRLKDHPEGLDQGFAQRSTRC